MADDNRQSDLAVMDANEFKQKHRLKQILEALDEIEESYHAAKGLYAAGEIDQDGKNIRLMYAVQRAIRETYNLVDKDDGIWDGHEFGTIAQETGSDKVIVGLEDYNAYPEFKRETYQHVVAKRNGPNETEREIAHHTMPEQISERVFLALKAYLNDQHDLDIAFEELDDKLQDERPKEIELPEGYDVEDIDDISEFEGPVDVRAVTGDDD
jgi:hypothetical protein